MMKRLLAVLLAVLLALGCIGAMAETSGREAFLGNWELYSIKLMGMTMGRSELSYNMICNIHEDDTVAFSLNDSFLVRKVQYTGNTCVIEDMDDMSPMTIDAEGMLCMTLTSDGVDMNIRMQRAAASTPAAEIAPIVGYWELESATMMGVSYGPETLGDITATFYPDHYGQMTMSDNILGTQLTVVNGMVQMDEDNGNSPVMVNEQGQLVIDLLGDDGAPVMVVTFNRAGDMAEQTPAAAPVEAAPFDGRWNAVKIGMIGMGMIETGEGDIWLEIGDGKAELYITGDTFDYTAAVEGSVCTLVNESETDTCTINEQGQLELLMVGDDVEIVIVMERDASPAATASSYDGKWVLVEVEMFGITMTAEQANVNSTLVVSGSTARMTYDNDSRGFNCSVVVTDTGLELSDSTTTISFTLNEKGQLCYEMPSENGTMIVRMERQAD